MRPWALSRSNSASTSAVARLSSAPVGSSARSSAGSVTSARAIATRCCWPPESCAGRWSGGRRARPRPSAATRPPAPLAAARRRRPAGSSTLASAMVRGIRLNDWKTKPILRLRTAASSSSSSVDDVDAVEEVAARRSGTSRQPMMFISVDLPEPEAPMMATKSPCSRPGRPRRERGRALRHGRRASRCPAARRRDDG